MFNSLIKFCSTLFAPLLAAILPLHQALAVLLLLVLINYVSQVIVSFKNDVERKNIFTRLIASIFSKTALQTLFKRIYEYSLAVVMVGLLEVYMLGITQIELATRTFSLLHFTIVVAGCLEVTRGFQLGEKITGSNMLETIKSFLPERLTRLFKKNGSNDDPQ